MEQFNESFRPGLSSVENIPRGYMLLSAIKACLSDESKIVKKGILDAMALYVRLEDTFLLSESQKVEMVEAMLCLLGRRDNTVNIKLYNWFFGEPEDNMYILDGSRAVVLEYIVKGFQRMFTFFEIDDVSKAEAR